MSIALFQSQLALAAKNNPLQTELEFVFTDFLPNKNNQAVPRSEAENIIQSARNMPIKIRFAGGKESGHTLSYPIGAISELWLDEDLIRAKAVIWNEEFPKEDEYLRKTLSEANLFTSWELFYQRAENVEGIDYLHGCTASATCIVQNPAYGDRTPIYAFASLMELENIQEALFSLFDMIDMMWYEEMQKEAEKTTLENASQALSRLNELVAAWKKNKGMSQELETRIAELEGELTTAQAELDTLKTEKAEAERLQAENERHQARVEQITESGVAYSEELMPREFVLSFSDDTFALYIKQLGTLKPAQAESKTKPRIPDTRNTQEKVSAKEIALALNTKEGTN